MVNRCLLSGFLEGAVDEGWMRVYIYVGCVKARCSDVASVGNVG